MEKARTTSFMCLLGIGNVEILRVVTLGWYVVWTFVEEDGVSSDDALAMYLHTDLRWRMTTCAERGEEKIWSGFFATKELAEATLARALYEW